MSDISIRARRPSFQDADLSVRRLSRPTPVKQEASNNTVTAAVNTESSASKTLSTKGLKVDLAV